MWGLDCDEEFEPWGVLVGERERWGGEGYHCKAFCVQGEVVRMPASMLPLPLISRILTSASRCRIAVSNDPEKHAMAAMMPSARRRWSEKTPDAISADSEVCSERRAWL